MSSHKKSNIKLSYNTNTKKKIFRLPEGDFRDVSIVKKNHWLQKQVPWTTVIRKDKAWRKSENRTFRPRERVKSIVDPYLFQSIPSDMNETVKRKRQNLNISQQVLALKSRIYLDKVINFENKKEVDFLTNYELYKILYVLDNYKEINNIKYIKFPMPKNKFSSLSEINLMNEQLEEVVPDSVTDYDSIDFTE